MLRVIALIGDKCGDAPNQRACNEIGNAGCVDGECTCDDTFIPSEDRTFCRCDKGKTLDKSSGEFCVESKFIVNGLILAIEHEGSIALC